MYKVHWNDLRHYAEHDRSHDYRIDGLASESCAENLCSDQKEENIQDEISHTHRNSRSIEEDGCKTGNSSTDQIVREKEDGPSQCI